MNTSANKLSSLVLVLTFSIVVMLLASHSTSSNAALQERVFENKIPAHIPIKIQMKKEKEESFKDLKNEKWLREFELEVTNTGDKPIYFLYITMDTQVMDIVFPLVYGRAELGAITPKATNDDIPIKPGEMIILRAGSVSLWERAVRENRRPEASKFIAELQLLSFGDGTGYFGTRVYPPPDRPKEPR